MIWKLTFLAKLVCTRNLSITGCLQVCHQVRYNLPKLIVALKILLLSGQQTYLKCKHLQKHDLQMINLQIREEV